MSDEKKSEQSREEIESYWTPERMADAKPRDYRPPPSPPDAAPPAPEGEPHDTPWYNPTAEDTKTDDDTEAGRPRADRATAPGLRGAARGGAAQVAAPVANPTQWPWCTVGKLYFVADGENYMGTAYSIYTNTLLTVAHNLYSQNVWSTHFAFIPALTGNTRPFGLWTYNAAHVMPDRFQTPTAAYDVGILWMNAGGTANQPIGTAVGYLGLTYNRTVPRDWIDVGYPGQETQMYADPGKYMASYEGGRTVSKAGTLGGGMSGSPWLLVGNTGLSNGIHASSRGTTEKLSPYFRDSIQAFIEANLV